MVEKKSQWESFKQVNGFGLASFDNFINEEDAYKLYEECTSSPKGGWTLFSRAGFQSFLFEPSAKNMLRR